MIDIRNKYDIIIIVNIKEDILMTLRMAKKLHNEDEVVIKKTSEVANVLNTQVSDDGKSILIETCDEFGVYNILGHKDIM